MKSKVLLSIVFVLVVISGSFAADKKYFYYGPDGKTYLDLSTEKILVQFDDNLSFAQKASLLSKESELQSLTEESVLPAPRVAMVRVKAGMAQERVEALLAKLNRIPGIVYANPFLIYSDGTLQGIQNKFLVRLRDASQFELLQRTASSNQVTIDSRDEYDHNLYHLSTTKSSPGNALDMANLFFETGLFQFAEPDFLRIMKINTPNDPNLNNQWYINNTGTNTSQYGGIAGSDLNVFDAWTLTTGSSSVKIAIIDEGVDLSHADLSANLLAGYDATGLGSNGGPNSSDAHGTNCAGISAAVGNNSIGVAGVAYGCKLIPIRMGYESPPGSGQLVTSNTWISNCFNYAWNTAGADVISNSWGGGSSSSTITNAINSATTSGRGGKGSAVIFSAGNDNSSVNYPATLSNVIAVAAMSMCDKRKSTSSCDGENFWGSNFGTNLDVGAPGVKMYTTDLTGSAGYSSTDYYSAFNGTSSACPAVAGVMALIFSANSNLTLTDARFDLESTCQKVGSYTYNSNVTGQPNGTWSNDLGYGRVDAYAAVQAALGNAGCNVPGGLTASAITSTGATLSWSSVTGATSYNIQYKPTASGTWTATTSSTTSKAISGLTSSTQYEFQVQASCPGGTSAFSSSTNFTTSVQSCTDVYEPNNAKGKAKAIPVGTGIQALIKNSTDKDFFSFANTVSEPYIKITVTNLPDDYDLKLFGPSGTKIASSENSGTGDENLVYNSGAPGTYKPEVYGFDGAFNATQCYTLTVFTSSSPFRLNAGDELSVKTLSDLSNIYPNPSNGRITVNYTSATDADMKLAVFDLMGKMVHTQITAATSGANSFVLDLNELHSGIYILQIVNGTEVSKMKFEVLK